MGQEPREEGENRDRKEGHGKGVGKRRDVDENSRKSGRNGERSKAKIE